jgi:UDP-N-acetylenolpyruvoylglucosamine reductase
MRLGGKARFVQEIGEVDQVILSYNFAEMNDLPVFVLGSGSNIIGRDEGYDGLVLVSRLKGLEKVTEDSESVTIKAYSGELLDDVCAYAAECGYSGIEAMSGIPGTIGAAPVQNVGAYGQEISNTLTMVEVYDSSIRRVCELSREECAFGYRKSVFNSSEKGRYFIISVTLKLSKDDLTPPFYRTLQDYFDKHEITDYSPLSVRKAVLAVRGSKLPDPKVIASAGSFFKNIEVSNEKAEELKARFPGIHIFNNGEVNKVSSGWLIENARLKGAEFFGMRVSDTAALILINESAGSYEDLAKARQMIIGTIEEKFGITLEQEPVELK